MSRYTETHKNPQGPGDARPTALQIVKDNNLIGKLEDKVAVITGISSGIGIETARALKATGMRVFGLELDMNSLDSVRACVKGLLSKTSTLNIFIANAGIMMTPEGRTADGFELQLGTNHLAHFLLFQLPRPTLLASTTPDFASRVITLSSIGHRGGQINFDNMNFKGTYDPMVAYAQSKLAAVYMANEIERRYGSQNLHAWSVMPGGIWTGLQQNMPDAVKDVWKADNEFQKAWKSAEQGAATTVWAAVDRELEGKGGRYLEDCGVAGPAPEPTGAPSDMGFPGYAAWAYDEGKAGRLWRVSCGMVGMESDA